MSQYGLSNQLLTWFAFLAALVPDASAMMRPELALLVGGALLVSCAAPEASVVVAPSSRAPAVEAGNASEEKADTRASEVEGMEPFPGVAPFRLPHTFEPTGYRASLAIGDRRFTGHMEITGDLAEQVSLVWLHGVDLVVTRASAAKDGTVVPLEFSPPRPDQLLGLRARSPLAPGRWTFSIDYSGPVREQEPPVERPHIGKWDPPALGLFRRKVGSDSYVFTQSEPIFARRIFPCIDEPDRKVPWQLTLEVRKDLIAASNTPIIREVAVDGHHKRVEFAETLPLPSYLVAFAVGPFEIVKTSRSRSGIPMRILVLRGRRAHVAAAARVAPQILESLENWLEIPYPYPKLDLVMVPHAGWGAMENPGLITFDQRQIEGDRSMWIISHELAHQWFGNLVTLSWWDDIWLNESFAEFMATKIEAGLSSGPGRDEPIHARLEALSELERTGRVRQSVRSLPELDFERFAPHEAIGRGIAILHLLETYLGPERFRQAIRRYVTTHANGVVTTDDLIGVISEAANVSPSKKVPKNIASSVASAITHLLDRPIPQLQMSLMCKGTVRVSFASVPWSMPVCIAYDRDGQRAEICTTIDESTPIVRLPARACPRWVMPDAGGGGLHRIAWTKRLVDPLLTKGWSSLTAAERRTLFGEIADPELKLAAFVRFIDHAGAQALPDEASYLAGIVRYVPEDLRPAFDAWINARFEARIPAKPFELSDAAGPEAKRQHMSIVKLLALTQAPRLAKQAALIAATYRDRPLDWAMEPALVLAATADPEVLEALLDDVVTVHPPRSAGRAQLLGVLAEVRSIPSALKGDAERLGKLDRREVRFLFSKACDRLARSDLAALVGTSSEPTFGRASIGGCIAVRARLEPVFRAWLGTPAGASPRPAR